MATTYTMDDFLAGKVSIRCDNEEQQKVILKICEENGIIWHTGQPIDADFPNKPVLTIGFHNDGRLTYGNGNHSGQIVVNFDEISFSHASKYQIIIESDGNTTTAKMVVNGKEVKTATAKRNPADKANWRTGAQVAFDRLWQKQEKPKKPTKAVVREVKRNAKVDEWVRIVNATNLWDEAYKNDDILQVERAYSDGATYLSCGGVYALPYEYVVLEGYQP